MKKEKKRKKERKNRNEELRAVCVSACVGHGKQAWLGVLDLEVLVVELATVNRLTSSTVTVRKVTTLDHEIGNDSVKVGAFVMERFAVDLTNSLFTSTKSSEVFDCFRNSIACKGEGKEGKEDDKEKEKKKEKVKRKKSKTYHKDP